MDSMKPYDIGAATISATALPVRVEFQVHRTERSLIIPLDVRESVQKR